MLTQRAIVPSSTFNRRDLRRLAVAAILLIASMTAIFALDLIPQRLQIAVGDVAATDIVAPRTDSYISKIQTQEAKDAARTAVQPVYDFGSEKADRIAKDRAAAFDRLAGPIDEAFKPGVKAADKAKILDGIGGLTNAGRATLKELDAARWKAVRDEASRVLDVTERNPITDNNVPTVKAALTQQMVGLGAAERSLAAELISPLIEANSSYSDSQTIAARQRAADLVADVVVPDCSTRGPTSPVSVAGSCCPS
jgi:membrane-associated HD superfamily phosphohydrolase